MTNRERAIVTWTMVVILGVLLSSLIAKRADAQTCAGSATLSWQPPTQNTDGSPLTNLAGFKVYWGLSTFTGSATLGPGLTSYVVQQLCAGTWKFVVTAFNAAGVESVYSNQASKAIAGSSSPTSPQVPAPTTVGGIVRTLLVTRDATLMPEVGSVAAGVPCNDLFQHVSGGESYMLVPVARVTPLAGVQIEAAWAVCR